MKFCSSQTVFEFRNVRRNDGARDPAGGQHPADVDDGAQLARLEGQIALRSLIDRFPDIALANAATPEWNDSLILRDMQSLPVRLR